MDNNFVSTWITKILDLYNKYKNDESLLEILNNNINSLDAIMENEYNKNSQTYNKQKDLFIEEFLNDTMNTLYYIKDNDLFINYDSTNYTIIKEDDIWHRIFTNLSSDLSSFKIEIKDEIMNKVKENDITNSLPESNTIQKIINYLTSVIFESKEESKYFLCLLGDSFLNKNVGSINIYTHRDSFIFLDYILSEHIDYFNLDNSNIIQKFSNEIINPLDNNRILKFKDSVINTDLWKDFIHYNFLNLISVAIHYSNRYENSEKYINQRSNKKLRLKILYLKNKNYLNIIDDFKLNMKKIENYKLSKNDMFYLWKIFLETKNIYDNITNELDLNILFDEHFEEESGYFLNFYDEKIEIINSFKSFIDNNIEFSSIDDELEVSELTNLYNKYCDEEKYLGEFNILSLLNYYYNKQTILINGKILLNISCKSWNKKKDLVNCIKNKFNVIENNDVSFVKAYKYYCTYLKDNKIKNTASKKYFEKHITKIIESKYISNNKILKDYWSN